MHVGGSTRKGQLGLRLGRELVKYHAPRNRVTYPWDGMYCTLRMHSADAGHETVRGASVSRARISSRSEQSETWWRWGLVTNESFCVFLLR
jgi:hypothetical protein